MVPAKLACLKLELPRARGDASVGFSKAVVCSNCEHIKFYIDDKLVAEVDPERKEFAHLRYAPFILEMSELFHKWGELRLDGYIQGKQVISKRLSGTGVDTKFLLLPDDVELIADGADSTRVVLRITDEFGAVRPFANDAIKLEVEGPAEIVGDNPFSLVGGTGAVWIRSQEKPGNVRLKAIHPSLGAQQVEIQIVAGAEETV
jgi:beta-galactosidase